MRRIAFLIALALPAAGCSAITPAAAVVNGVKVSESTIEEELDRARDAPEFQELVRRQGDAGRGQARRDILTSVISVTIRRQEARTRRIRISSSEVSKLVDGLRRQLGEERFSQELKNANLTLARLRELGRRQLLEEELRKSVTKDLKVDDAKVQAAYEQSKSEFAELHLAKITVPTQAEAQDVAAKASAPGADFADLAKKLSKDSVTAPNGGDLGYVEVAAIDRALRAQLDPVPVGGIAGPLQGRGGFDVYKVLDRRVKPIEQVRETITEDLLDRDRGSAFDAFMRQRLQKARIVVNPKYGKFDRRQLQVVAGPAGLPE